MTSPNQFPQPDQYELLTIADCYAELDPSQQRDLRAHFARIAMAALNAGYELTDALVVDGEEAKSRRKRVEVPEGWLEVER